jgi:iron complex transport system substrate-binding protein
MSNFFNTTNKKLVLGIVLLVVLIGGSYGVYTLYFTPEPTEPGPTETEPTETEPTETEPTETEPTETEPTETEPTETEPTETEPIETEPENTTITIVDVNGVHVNISLPVNRIVSFTSGVTEIVYALGAGDKLVGRDTYSTFPDAVSEVTVVYESSGGLNMEVLTELEPDLVISDTRLDNETRAQIEELLGVPVIIDNPSQADRIEPLITYLGLILDAEETADELLDFMDDVVDLVEDRVATLPDNERPLVYYEWVKEWFSCNSASLPHQMLIDAGGRNLAANETSTYPTLSAEYVLERNPDVVIRIITSSTHNLTDFETLRDQLMTRDGLSETTAVQEGDVYVMEGFLRTGIRNPIGLLTFAKWFHPELFADVDPTAIHAELVQTFFDVELEGTYAYPEIYAYTDVTEEVSILHLPVTEVVSTSSGWTDLIVAISGLDVLVGRNQYSTFPPALADVPVVAATSSSPNVELILELQPDIVFADTMLAAKPEVTQQLRDAGIVVIIEDTTNITKTGELAAFLGRIMNNEEKAADFNDWFDYCLNLVDERVANLTDDEKPLTYLGSQSFRASGPTGEAGMILTRAGGNNIIANASVYSTDVSAEFVLEANPEFIFSMTASVTIPTNTTSYEASVAAIVDSLLSATTAVKEGQVYTYSYRLVQGIFYPISVLYFAKCLHPTLFADIDPAAIHADMIQQFFGIESEGVYYYP